MLGSLKWLLLVVWNKACFPIIFCNYLCKSALIKVEVLPEIIFGLIQATPEREVTMKLQSLDRSVITSVSVEKVSLTCDEAVQKKALFPGVRRF